MRRATRNNTLHLSSWRHEYGSSCCEDEKGADLVTLSGLTRRACSGRKLGVLLPLGPVRRRSNERQTSSGSIYAPMCLTSVSREQAYALRPAGRRALSAHALLRCCAISAQAGVAAAGLATWDWDILVENALKADPAGQQDGTPWRAGGWQRTVSLLSGGRCGRTQRTLARSRSPLQCRLQEPAAIAALRVLPRDLMHIHRRFAQWHSIPRLYGESSMIQSGSPPAMVYTTLPLEVPVPRFNYRSGRAPSRQSAHAVPLR